MPKPSIVSTSTEFVCSDQDIRKLAEFARLSPNPMLEFGADGKLTYYNKAAMQAAKSCGKDHPSAIIPLNTASIVKNCLNSGQNRLHVGTPFKGRTLSWSFFPILPQNVVHGYAEDITDSLNLEAQLRQMQKMESVGQLAAGIAHDFNNVLTVIQGHSGLLLADGKLDPLLAESARQISLAAERAANLTRQLLAFSRKQVMQPQLLNLNEVIANVSKMLRTLIGANVKLQCDAAVPLSPVYADVGMLEQVLINLSANARDAMPEGGTIRISTGPADIDEAYVQDHPEARTGAFVCLSIADTGTGMDALTLNRIFEPFFTTKESGRGTGLGLSTVYGIIKQHRGWMEVHSQLGQGTTFKIFLPARSKAQLHTNFLRRSDVPGGQETILVVEDEAPLRKVMQEVLQKKGYTILEASTGAQALKIWRTHRARIHMLLTDLVLPERLSGRHLAQTILAEKPGLKVLYTSGYNPETIHPGFTPKDGTDFLQKPYHPETLAKAVRACLDN